jgi:hypothetical protein
VLPEKGDCWILIEMSWNKSVDWPDNVLVYIDIDKMKNKKYHTVIKCLTQ